MFIASVVFNQDADFFFFFLLRDSKTIKRFQCMYLEIYTAAFIHKNTGSLRNKQTKAIDTFNLSSKPLKYNF